MVRWPECSLGKFVVVGKSLILWILFLPLLLTILLPILLTLVIYKSIVFLSARLFRSSDLLQPINGVDISFCVDDFWTRPKGGTSFISICKGPTDPKLIHDRFRQAIIEEGTRDGKSASSIRPYNYERLTSVYPSFFMGYPFWTRAKREFRMENHIKVIECPVQRELPTETGTMKKDNSSCIHFESQTHLNQFLCSWMRRGFQEGLPLWEVMVVPEFYIVKENDEDDDRNSNGKKNTKLSLIGLKIHHIIGDGYSKLRLLEKVVDDENFRIHEIDSFQENKETDHVQNILTDKGGRNQHRKHDHHLPLNNNSNTNVRSSLPRGGESSSNVILPLPFSVFCKDAFLHFLLTPITLLKLCQDFVFHHDCFTHRKTTSDVFMSTATLEMDKLREIRRNFKTQCGKDIPMIVIGAAVFAGALRQFLCTYKMNANQRTDEIKCEKPDSEFNGEDLILQRVDGSCGDADVRGNDDLFLIDELPRHTNIVMALPLGTSHPGDYRFCNHWTHGIFSVEIEEPDSIRRVMKLNENFRKTLSMKWPDVYHYALVPWQTLLPRFVWRRITEFNMGASIGSTNMIGPSVMKRVGGQEIVNKYAYVGLLWTHSSMTCAFFSYNGNLSATLVANENVMGSPVAAEKLMQEYMHGEVENLLKLSSGSQ